MMEWLSHIEKGTRILVLHPRYGQRRVLIGDLLSQRSCTYWRVPRGATSVDALKANLAQVQRPDARWLICDDADELPGDILADFLSDILAMAGYDCVVINGREFLSIAQLNRFEAGQIQFYPVNPDMMLPDYTQLGPGERLLEVCALGMGSVHLDGTPIRNWDGSLARLLFYFFVDRAMVTRDAIFQAFWPNMPVREATNVFHVTKRKLNEALGLDLTVYNGGYYRIAPQIRLIYDVNLFTRHSQSGAAEEGQAQQTAYQRMLDLYTGGFLEGMTPGWVVDRRTQLEQVLLDALLILAEDNASADASEQAVGYYARAAQIQQDDASIAYPLMKLYLSQNRHEMAMLTYERYRAGGGASASQLDELYSLAKAGQTS